jgi:hypothetical protein
MFLCKLGKVMYKKLEEIYIYKSLKNRSYYFDEIIEYDKNEKPI